MSTSNTLFNKTLGIFRCNKLFNLRCLYIFGLYNASFGSILADQILGSKKVTYGAILLVIGHLGMTVESNQQIFGIFSSNSFWSWFQSQIYQLWLAHCMRRGSRRDSGFTIFYGHKYWCIYSNTIVWIFRRDCWGAYGFGAAGIECYRFNYIFMGQKYLEGLAEPPSESIKRIFILYQNIRPQILQKLYLT